MPFPDFGNDPAWPSTPKGALLEEARLQALGREAFRGRTAVITGGATGLGRAAAVEFGRLGCNVAFCFVDMPGRDVRETALLTETTLSTMGVGVYAEVCDVRDRAAVARFMYEVCDRFDSIHYLVNNAGIANDGALWRLSEASWSEVIDTNLTGAFNCISAVAPLMRGQHYGKIVSISSHQAQRPGFGVSSYAASKAALESLTRSAAVELGPSNVNVNAIAPGFVRTERLELLPPEVIDRARKSAVLGRIGEPAEIAQIITFLCSEAARHITGQTLVVDGGLSLG